MGEHCKSSWICDCDFFFFFVIDILTWKSRESNFCIFGCRGVIKTQTEIWGFYSLANFKDMKAEFLALGDWEANDIIWLKGNRELKTYIWKISEAGCHWNNFDFFFPVNLVVTKGARLTAPQRKTCESGRCDVSSCLRNAWAGGPAVALSERVFRGPLPALVTPWGWVKWFSCGLVGLWGGRRASFPYPVPVSWAPWHLK